MWEIANGLGGGLGLLMGAVWLIVVLYLVPVPLWIAAWASGAYVGLLTLIGMRLRRVPPGTVVTARISAVRPASTFPSMTWKPTFLRAATS